MAPTSAPPSLRRLAGVVARNPGYRKLFIAGAVSQMGDWFNVVALFSLLLDLTGKGEAIAAVFILRSLGSFFMGPWAGVLADRVSRRGIMICADLVRGFAMLGFLLVRDVHQVWIAYVLVVVQGVGAAFFDPAQIATVPNLVGPDEIILASAVENTLWSFALAVGAGLAGTVMLIAGRDTAFLVDSLSFFVSAFFILRLPRLKARTLVAQPLPGAPVDLPTITPPTTRSGRVLHALGFADALQGARYIAGHRRIRALILVKGAFGITLGGALVLLTIFGEQLLGHGHGTGIALLWTARGVGSILGPLVAWKLGGDSEPALRRGITIAYVAIASMYLCLAPAPNLVLAAIFLAAANAGGSLLWTFGAALQQVIVPDEVRGRVFAADNSCMTLTMTVSTFAVGVALDHGVGPRTLMALCGAMALPALVYWVTQQRYFEVKEKREPA